MIINLLYPMLVSWLDIYYIQFTKLLIPFRISNKKGGYYAAIIS